MAALNSICSPDQISVQAQITTKEETVMEEVDQPNLPINAWRFNANDDLPCKKHQFAPNRKVSEAYLAKLGVLTWTQIDTKEIEKNDFLNIIKTVRGYNYEEVLTVSPATLPDFEENTTKFFMEHLHDHEEIRFIIDGVGYEDVRDFNGEWIRIEIKKGDLIVLPPGMYHRFTLDENQYLKALLLYQGTPSRIQFEKSPEADVMEARWAYVQSVLMLEADEEAEADAEADAEAEAGGQS